MQRLSRTTPKKHLRESLTFRGCATAAWIILSLLSGCKKNNPTIRLSVIGPDNVALPASGDVVSARIMDSSGEVFAETTVAARDISLQGVGSSLFSGLDLDPDSTYLLDISVDLSTSGSTACRNQNRLNGRSLPIKPNPSDQNTDLELTVQLRCADESVDLVPLQQSRIFHTTTWIPAATDADNVSTSDMIGDLWIIGGARGQSNLLFPRPDDILNSIEVINFLPASTGKGTETVSRSTVSNQIIARAAHTANQVINSSGQPSIIIAGGYTTEPAGIGHKLVARAEVERVNQTEVESLAPMQVSRAGHASVVINSSGEQRILFIKGSADGYVPPYLTSYESYDPKQANPSSLIENNSGVGLLFPRAVLLPDNRVISIGGLWDRNESISNEVAQVSSDSSCTLNAPCIELAPGFPAAEGRLSPTATYVPCEDNTQDGAIYITGGGFIDEILQPQDSNDIYCIDTTQLNLPPKRVGRLSRARINHTATLIDGPEQSIRLFVAGGPDKTTANRDVGDATADIFPVSCTCDTIEPDTVTTVSLNHRRIFHTATRLPDGSVLLVGGRDTDTIERFFPDM